MHRAGPALWLYVAIAAGVTACGSNGPPNTPSAPSFYVGGDDDGGGGIAVGPHHEAGADEDAGVTDPGPAVLADAGGFDPVPTECENVTPANPADVGPDGTLFDAVSSPADLGVTRVEATWDGDCVRPTIRVTLSDGRCPLGNGHEVEFRFDAGAIASGKLSRGVHYLEPEPGNVDIRVRYRRPTSLDPVGAGAWGTCLGVVGTLDLPIAPGVDERDELRGRFQMELAPCDSLALATRSVNGTFDVTLRRGLGDVCPTAK